MQTYNIDTNVDVKDYAATVEFSIPVVSASLPVEIVGRRVCQPQDMFDWERSEARAEVLVFVQHMNDVTKRYPTAAFVRQCQRSRNNNVSRSLAVLRTVSEWAAKCSLPARHDNLSRAITKCFCHFHGQLRADGRTLLDRTYGGHGLGRADYRDVMLPVYLEQSFGDPNTMTYGPAHELSFCAFLVSLFKLRHLTLADEPYVVTVIFDK